MSQHEDDGARFGYDVRLLEEEIYRELIKKGAPESVALKYGRKPESGVHDDH